MNILNFFRGKQKFDTGNDWDTLLEQLKMHRVGGIAYQQIMSGNSVVYYPKKFIEGLESIHNNYRERNEHMTCDIEYLCELFKMVDCDYAFLKGGYLIPFEYELGMRVSNDIDILVDKNAVSCIQSILKQNGFIQGQTLDGQISPATRKEIIHSKLNFGETVPFLKQIESRILEVDLNISLDFKADNQLKVQAMLKSTIVKDLNGHSFKTLKLEEFIIHLCCHLYKEATIYDWITRNKNMLLYKFYDIYFLLKKYGNEELYKDIMRKIAYYEAEKECYYSLYYVKEIFGFVGNSSFQSLLEQLLEIAGKDCLREAFYPLENKKYKFVGTFEEWFFSSNKIEKLQEITED